MTRYGTALEECFVYWSAWQTLVDYVSRSEPRDADPRDIYGASCAVERDRLAALLYGHHHGESLPDATALLERLLNGAKQGFRPRYGREMGITLEAFR